MVEAKRFEGAFLCKKILDYMLSSKIKLLQHRLVHKVDISTVLPAG